jgi:hypothetical protein
LLRPLNKHPLYSVAIVNDPALAVEWLKMAVYSQKNGSLLPESNVSTE